MDKQDKNERKVRFMKIILREKLLKMIKAKPTGKISVSSLCEEANISRATFYKYYVDAEDLLNHIISEYSSKVGEYISEINIPALSIEMFEQIFIAINQNRDLAELIFDKHRNRTYFVSFICESRDYFIDQLKKELPNLDRTTLDYIYLFVSNGIEGLAEKWILNNFEQPPKAMAKLCYDFTQAIIKSKNYSV